MALRPVIHWLGSCDIKWFSLMYNTESARVFAVKRISKNAFLFTASVHETHTGVMVGHCGQKLRNTGGKFCIYRNHNNVTLHLQSSGCVKIIQLLNSFCRFSGHNDQKRKRLLIPLSLYTS